MRANYQRNEEMRSFVFTPKTWANQRSKMVPGCKVNKKGHTVLIIMDAIKGMMTENGKEGGVRIPKSVVFL